LVIIYLFQPRKFKINIYTLLVSSVQLSLARFLGDPAHFNGPGLPVDRFSIGKKHFFMNTNNVRGFFLQQGRRRLTAPPYYTGYSDGKEASTWNRRSFADKVELADQERPGLMRPRIQRATTKDLSSKWI
jgi:hypothetical protein